MRSTLIRTAAPATSCRAARAFCRCRRPRDPIFFGNPTYEIQSNRIGKSFVKSWETSAKIDYDLGWGTLTSITSYTDVDSGNDQDLDQTLFEAIDIIVIDQSETIAQELRLVSDSDQALRWVGWRAAISRRIAFVRWQRRSWDFRCRQRRRISNLKISRRSAISVMT